MKLIIRIHLTHSSLLEVEDILIQDILQIIIATYTSYVHIMTICCISTSSLASTLIQIVNAAIIDIIR